MISEEEAQREREDRQKIEKALNNKLQEISAIKERLFSLRYDPTLSSEDRLRHVENHIKELNRLERGFLFLHETALANFEQSLHLTDLGLGSPITTSAAKKKEEPKSVRPSLPKQLSSDDLQDLSKLDNNLKMMRTKSTNTLENQNPSQRWQSLLRMFKEWRHNTTVAQAQHIVANEDKELKREQIAKLRAAILSLQQQKSLTQTDKLLLEQLRNRLRTLSLHQN
ncbi:hypothetical protein QOT17_003080 [Balamuthia mandrillaris]